MEVVEVLVTTALDEECIRQITTVSPKINLRDVSDFADAEKRGDFSSREQFDAHLAEAEIIYGARPPKNVIARAPKLKWIQTTDAGVDSFLDSDIIESSVIVTNTSGGVHAVSIAECVLEMMLMFVKKMPLCFQLKQERQWKMFNLTVLHSKTVGIVGLGSIGRQVARLSKAFGMRVLATRRSTRSATRTRSVDMLFSQDQLPQLLSDSDFVVLALPLTPETNNLIGEEELRAMKPTAYLINIARGNIVDEATLTRALEENWIAGAGLDVFVTEPLPIESRLWELPNVIFSPHVAAEIEDYDLQATRLFADNLRRYLSGKRLRNVVDKKRGY
ncbi:MAG: D-2-hydroxyacid dehydrogenase [Chloroflexi bacterium]|nr:MAG: D-2-hydroxyacid dehydrogenase [Chloroflexota bacterium]